MMEIRGVRTQEGPAVITVTDAEGDRRIRMSFSGTGEFLTAEEARHIADALLRAADKEENNGR